MSQTGFLRFRPVNRFRLALSGGLLATCALTIWFLAVEVHRQLEHQSSSKLDNVQWALSQVEVELIRLVLATENARQRGGSLADVRLRYDVFYSRLATLKDASIFSGLRETQDFVECIKPVELFVAKYLPLIDGPDDALRRALPKMSAEADDLTNEAREIALEGVQYFAEVSDRDRKAAERTLDATAAVTILLVTALVTLILLLLRLDRVNRGHALENLQTLSRLDAIVATAQESIITINDRGRIVDFNGAATQTFGYTRAEIIGSDMTKLIADESDRPRIFQSGVPPMIWGQGQVRITTCHKNGRHLPVELSISQTMSGQERLYVAFMRDLSAQLAAERALMAARDEALAGEKAKSDLLVVMSHEIRTPLNGMIGSIELLGASGLLPHQREYLRILEASGRLLMHHVNDVLDIARLDSGKATNMPVPVDLAELVQEVLENQTYAARGNANSMHYKGPVDGRSSVLVDGALLRQVLLNLVGNAVKFTRDGEILVSISHLSATGPTVISVSDSGIGIPAADLDRIFDDFVTLDASYARRSSGTGLGLGIVKRIAARMGGQLQVVSQPGKGSVFRVTLPLTILDRGAGAPAGPDLQIGAQQVQRPLTALVIEDNVFNRMIIRDMLLQDGHEVAEAQDGLEGIALAASRNFDVILMDISMPRVDGLQAAKAIAQDGASRNTPIIAMTAHAQAADNQRFKAVGMHDALIKPITRQGLRAALLRAQSQGAPEAARPLIDTSILEDMASSLGSERCRQLIDRFLAETGQSILSLTGARLDQAGIREIHRLEGSAAMFGALALRQAMSQMQLAWNAGATEDAHTKLQALQALWQQTHAAYRDREAFSQLSSLR